MQPKRPSNRPASLFPQPKYVKFGNYSGFKVDGTANVVPMVDPSHMNRAFYLMAKLEAPKWGAVQSYDGCGISGGPSHFVAVYPQNLKQGGLFDLVRRLEVGVPDVVVPVQAAFATVGMFVAKDGRLRYRTDSKEVTGKVIRNLFTPPDGKVPESGAENKQALHWIKVFSNLLRNVNTFPIQTDYAIEYLISGCNDVEMHAYNMFLPKLKKPEMIGVGENPELPPEVDLAMAVYHAFSPNAPAIAQGCLKAAIDSQGRVKKADPESFARSLITKLGTKKYGKWEDTTGVGQNRYDNCRFVAVQSGLWPKPLTDKLLPVDLKR